MRVPGTTTYNGIVAPDDPELARALRGLDEAAEFARTYRFELTDDYLALIARVEALPQNQPGADKSGVWRAMDAYKDFFRRVRPALRGS
jgi:hypothetical protein